MSPFFHKLIFWQLAVPQSAFELSTEIGLPKNYHKKKSLYFIM